MQKLNFWQKNQVIISGLSGALVIVLQQALGKPAIDYPTLGLAALVAAGGVLGNTLRGKGVSIAGIIGVVGSAVYTVGSTGHISIPQLILTATIGFLSIVAPPPKPSTYETNAAIVEAKEIPPMEQVVDDTKIPLVSIPGTTKKTVTKNSK